MDSEVKVYDKHYINGLWVGSSSTDLIDVFDSNTGSVVARVVSGNSQDVDAAVAAAADAFSSWSQTPLKQRKGYLQRILGEYMKRAKQIAEALVCELGAPREFAEKVQVNR